MTADYRLLGYFRDEQGIFVNMYLPSTLRWTGEDGAQLTLTQSGNYPVEGKIAMQIRASHPSKFALRLRIPSWTTAQIRVNGNTASTPIQLGFATLRRQWKDGDRVEVEMTFPMRLEAIDDQHPNTVALLRGPLVLFSVTEDARRMSREELLGAKRVGGEAGWKAGELSFVPFTELKEEGYRTYLEVG